jgi:hypothetical protein
MGETEIMRLEWVTGARGHFQFTSSLPTGPTMSDDSELRLKRYLGDGVYAGFDGYQIWVWAARAGREHRIAFEAETLASLAKYTADLKRMAHDAESLNRERI